MTQAVEGDRSIISHLSVSLLSYVMYNKRTTEGYKHTTGAATLNINFILDKAHFSYSSIDLFASIYSMHLADSQANLGR